jgi:biopolymer transport protein ExbD
MASKAEPNVVPLCDVLLVLLIIFMVITPIYSTRQDKTIFIRADAKLPYSRVIELIDIAKGAGVETLGIIPEYFTDEEM